MAELVTVKVSEKGQVVIPKDVREKLKLHKGDKLVILIEGEKMLIEKSKKTEKKIKDDFSDLLKASESSLDFWFNEKDKVWEQSLSKLMTFFIKMA